jgi:hypothetical protein
LLFLRRDCPPAWSPGAATIVLGIVPSPLLNLAADAGRSLGLF